MLQQFVRGVLGVVLATAMAVAQAAMGVTSGTLTPGQSVQIDYCDPSRANTPVTITIDDGAFPIPTIYVVVIYLDSKGKGSASWIVPECEMLRFNAEGVRQLSRWVN
jgi:hypothetical protein